ncbi:hypothetical protein NQ317_015727 [Molorchus minor]|uniref:Uncharacterized protein n=1 Tax=Molorchus minor TaxID=1323400 RepID=A0ABQ9IXP2_9CUCU|nr:hypothetical protein NQ317_015727 [Molorchus minor]
MATLTVKNCIPQGYEACSLKTKKRKTKVAQQTRGTISENNDYREHTAFPEGSATGAVTGWHNIGGGVLALGK